MFSIFVWSFVSGLLTTVAAEAGREMSKANKDYNSGVQRHRKQREITDLLTRGQ